MPNFCRFCGGEKPPYAKIHCGKPACRHAYEDEQLAAGPGKDFNHLSAYEAAKLVMKKNPTVQPYPPQTRAPDKWPLALKPLCRFCGFMKVQPPAFSSCERPNCLKQLQQVQEASFSQSHRDAKSRNERIGAEWMEGFEIAL